MKEMHFDHRTVRQLMLFATVTQERSLRRAAKRLNMSVPPLASQLDELEGRLKLKLLERTPRGIRLTDHGKALLPMVNTFVAQAEVLEFSVKQLQAETQGVITVGANAEAMMFHIPKLKNRLAVYAPGISLFVKELDSCEVEDQLGEGTVSMAIAFFDSVADPRLSMITLTREKPNVLLNQNHPLCASKELYIRDLSRENFVFARRAVSPSLFDGLINFCKEQGGFMPKVVHEVESSPRQMGFVSCGQGIAFLPKSFKNWVPEYVVAKEIADATACLPLSVAWNSQRSSPMRDTAIKILKDIFA